MSVGMDHRVGVFIQKAKRWPDELSALREILLSLGLTETFKWRQPCYAFEGDNIIILWAFKENCGLGFFKGVLLKDPHKLLIAPGENTRSARKLGFTSVADIREKDAIIREYVAEAIEISKAGLKPDMPKDDLEMPAELAEALASDQAFADAFDALTPGRKRGYFLVIGQAKQSETRARRVEKWKPQIMAGKGMHD